ncbi:MAG: flagellar basal body-associated FliL family protein [Planctomycetes bacterium]|nr:flagellar basal body-associated FliL family protein [Planctomycetota bacterium]
MAGKEEAAAAEEPKKKSKLVPILIGVVLVVGGAVATVAMTSPPKDQTEEKVDLNKLEATRYDKQLDWSFNLKGGSSQGMGRLKVSFDYKAEDPLQAAAKIEKGWDKARSDVRFLLFSKRREDFNQASGYEQLQLEVARLLEKAFFPDSDGIVSDVYFLEFIVS